MNKLIDKLKYFSKTEKLLWGASVLLIVVSFVLFDRTNYFNLIASLIGVTSLIYNAKGNPLGPGLMIIFSIMYGVISFSYAYYGEMITYLGMTMPMAILSLVAWLRHPFKGNKAEVEIQDIHRVEVALMIAITVVVTIAFYYNLKAFGTANLIPSTLSVTTSFIAAYLTFRRNPYYAVAYAANDIILIILWSMATVEDIKYISVIICFAAFLANDIYGFINWKAIQNRQEN